MVKFSRRKSGSRSRRDGFRSTISHNLSVWDIVEQSRVAGKPKGEGAGRDYWVEDFIM